MAQTLSTVMEGETTERLIDAMGVSSPEERTEIDRKQRFRQFLLNRIQDRIGLTRSDQKLMEVILVDICSKITSVYIGCLAQFEDAFGEDVWGYKVDEEQWETFTPNVRTLFAQNAEKWRVCRDKIKVHGDGIIDYVIDKLSYLHLSAPPQNVIGQMYADAAEISSEFRRKKNRSKDQDTED